MVSTLNVSSYIDYFRQLAVHHKDIQHSVESETGDGAIGSKHFARWSAEEVVTGLRSSISFTPSALLLELYEVVTQSESPFDIKGQYKGAFTVLAHAALENIAAEIDAFELTESICYDLLAQIWQDHYGEDAQRDSTPFSYFDFSNLSIIPVSKLFDNEFGYRIEFGFEFRQTKNISTPPIEGTFI
jgi:hypothetical protein